MLKNKQHIQRKTNPFVNFALLVLYKISLDILYIYGIAPFWDYSGLTYEFQSEKYFISSMVFLLVSPFIIKLYKSDKPSSLVVLIINLIYFTPGCTIYSFADITSNYFLFFSFYWFLFLYLHYRLPVFRIKLSSSIISKQFFYISFILIVASAIVMTGVYNGFRLNFDLMNVYELRTEMKEMNLPLIVRYIRPLVSSLVPITCIYFLLQKKRTIAITLIIVQLFLFGFGGNKTVLFFMILAILIYYFYTYKANRYIVLFLIVLNIVPFIEMYVTESFSMTAGVIQRRNMYLVNNISYQYYDFFSTHEFDYLRQSLFSKIGIESPYSNISGMMMEHYVGADGSLNNGMCGDAFMNFGWFGLLIYPFLINIALKFFDACSRGLDYKILVVVSVIFAVNFTNSYFFTVMVTHGFILICLFLKLMPRPANYSSSANGC